MFRLKSYLMTLLVCISMMGLLTAVDGYAFTVPDTGVSKCYDSLAEIPCPSYLTSLYGQDGTYQVNPPSFTKLAAGGVELPHNSNIGGSGWLMTRDNVTGLVWEMKTDDGSIHDRDNYYTWCNTNPATNGGDPGDCSTADNTADFINSLNTSSFGGYSDWRLPTREELQSIVNYGEPRPVIDAKYFPNTQIYEYWTADTYAGNPGYGWHIFFDNGNLYYGNKDFAYYVRAVRGGQNPTASRWVVNGDGTVTDSQSGLMWQQETDGVPRGWIKAIEYCDALELAGHNDWRLPTVKELATLLTLNQINPAADNTAFPGIQANDYWTSTTFANDPRNGWLVNFYYGFGYYYDKGLHYNVRAVRAGQGSSSRPVTFSSFLPSFVHMAGGTEVIMTGSGFGYTPPNALLVDALSISFLKWTDTEVIFIAPPHAAGTADITLAMSDGRIINIGALSYTNGGPVQCSNDAQCGASEYCKKPAGNCGGVGTCQPLPTQGCDIQYAPVCGCDGKSYESACQAELQGVNIISQSDCSTTANKWSYYFPSIKDDDAQGWENYLSVQAKEPVLMEVTIRVYDLQGTLAGTFIYSNTNPAAKAAAIAPNARVALRPSWIAGSVATPQAIEGSVIVETNVPAIASTNCIASSYKGFSIYEAAQPRPIHFFPKAFDGPDNFQVYILVQNIFDEPRDVTVKLFGKTAASPGNGVTKTVTIPPFGTLKIRPSEIADGINFDGSVVVYSNLANPEDGLGPAVPAMCRYEAGSEAISIYESTAPQPSLSFPILKDGKFGGSLDYQNYLSVVNPNQTTATVTVLLHNLQGTPDGRQINVNIPAGGKMTWRPSWIKGGGAATASDFLGAALVLSSLPVVGQTNTIYPGSNAYGTDAFDLFESAMPSSILFFPKAFDNLLGSGLGANHLFDNYIAIHNSSSTLRSVNIEQFNNNGTPNGSISIGVGSHNTYIYRPKSLVTDGSGMFRGSVRITEINGKTVTGALKYEFHNTTSSTSPIGALTIYRSMGQ